MTEADLLVLWRRLPIPAQQVVERTLRLLDESRRHDEQFHADDTVPLRHGLVAKLARVVPPPEA